VNHSRTGLHLLEHDVRLDAREAEETTIVRVVVWVPRTPDPLTAACFVRFGLGE
jgi:hypothetical protein